MPVDVRATSSGSAGKTTGGLTDTLGHKSVLDKQRATIEKLRTQNDQLKADLLLENKFSVRPGDPYAQVLINKLQDEGDLLARKIVLEMRKCRMLEQQLGEIGTTLTTTRRNMGGIYSAKEQSQTIQKQIKILEDRLEKSYIKFNEALTHNKQLREQINNLRRERLMFESINSNLERELHKLKKDMAEMIQLANAAFESKERAIMDMNKLKIEAEKEQQGFEEEWRLLTGVIEDDKRERERARAQELAVRERETQELLKMGALGTDKTKRKVKTQWSIGYSKAMAQNVAAEKVQKYGEAFEKIQQATGIEDIDELVNTFINAEDQNYTLFNYVNEVNQEIEKLEDQINSVRGEIDKYRAQGSEQDKVKAGAVREVEERLAGAEGSAELYEKRYEAASSTVNMLKGAIWELFNKIGCNTPAVRQLVGEDGVQESNVMSFLSIIEQRTNELLQLYALRKAGDAGDTVLEALVAQPLTANSGTRIIIEPPSTHEEDPDASDQEADDEKPLSRENLESRVQKTLGKKLETSIKIKPAGSEIPGKKSPGRK